MSTTLLDRMIDSFVECLTEDAARKVVDLRAESALQSRVDELAGLANRGMLNADDEAEYDRYLAGFHFVTMIQAKARKLLP